MSEQERIGELELRVRELEIGLSKTIEMLTVVSGDLANHTRVIARLIGLFVAKLEEI